MTIETIKLGKNGYLVNGSISVPNGHTGWIIELIEDWLKHNTPEPEFTQEEIMQSVINRFVNLVGNHIQAQVDAHNVSAQTAYTNAKGVEAYSKTPEHWDVVWCASLWAFNVRVWNFVRVELLPTFDFTKTITDDEFLLLLPQFEDVA